MMITPSAMCLSRYQVAESHASFPPENPNLCAHMLIQDCWLFPIEFAFDGQAYGAGLHKEGKGLLVAYGDLFN